MRRRPQDPRKPAISLNKSLRTSSGDIGLVLSGGGARAAYQVGVLRALAPLLEKSSDKISVVVGSSIGAINGLVFSAGLKGGLTSAIETMEALWCERTFRNTFEGSPSRAFLRAIQVAFLQYMAPGPHASSRSIFNPRPLMERVDGVIDQSGGLTPDGRAAHLRAVAVMTTVEGSERKPLLFLSSHKKIDPEVLQGASFDVCYVDSLHAKHGFASAALPSVLPPVEIDTEHGLVRLVDGGISQNVPVDPAVRLGSERVIIIDISGRDWWFTRAGEAHDTRPTWEVPAAMKTFCMRPPDTLVIRCQRPLGPLLKEAVASSTRKFIAAVGPTWPIFTLLNKKVGEEVAYEVMSYCALDPDFLQALIERGYSEARQLLRSRLELSFHHNETFEEVVKAS